MKDEGLKETARLPGFEAKERLISSIQISHARSQLLPGNWTLASLSHEATHSAILLREHQLRNGTNDATFAQLGKEQNKSCKRLAGF